MKKPIPLLTLLLLFFNSGCTKGSVSTNSNPDIYADFHNESKAFMKKNGIKGLAVAIFDNKEIIWKNAYGKSTYKHSINDSTMFSIQSVSKNFTALAVMIAVEEDLLNLDVPISEYLPDFNVNSCFEQNPETKITLRMLLSNTSGLPHEAPIGNNYDYSFTSIEEHLKSIEETWLKFPVGTNYFYSNLGFDLAAQIVEKLSGLAFDEYLRLKVFQPHGMNNSTINNQVVVNERNKTDGIEFGVKRKHYSIPLIGSGAVYSSLNDMMKYVQMHLNYGEKDGNRLITRESLLEMYKVNLNNYGLGTYIDTLYDSYYLNHNGGGFGFGSSMLWFPEYNIGCIVLANKPANCFTLASAIVSKYINANNSDFLKDTMHTNDFNPFDSLKEKMEGVLCCVSDSIFRDKWLQYLGSYKIGLGGREFKWYAKTAFAFGYKPFTIKVSQIDDELWINTNWLGKSKLYEYQPGLFFTKGGRALDFRNGNLIYDNLRIVKY
jgi:CubicO group peptidase (beta-lactamase class C family)